MTQPEHARQSCRETDAILSTSDLIRSGRGFSDVAVGFMHSSDGARKSSKSASLFANILNTQILFFDC